MTKVTSTQIVNSTLDSTPIGASARSTIAAVSALVGAGAGSDLSIAVGTTPPSRRGITFGADPAGDVTLWVNGNQNNPAFGVRDSNSGNTLATIGIAQALFSVSAALSAGGTSTTPGASDNSTNIATTAWSKVGLSSQPSQGYLQLPTWMGGLIIQGGHVSAFNTGPQAVSFPKAFPTQVITVVATDDFGSGGSRIISVVSPSQYGFSLRSDGSGNGAYWFALGY